MDSVDILASSQWIAIGPPRSENPIASRSLETPEHVTLGAPPSFRDAQFDIVLRRQRTRPPGGGGLKLSDLPSRFLNLSDHFEFAGWGSVTRLKLDAEDHRRGEEMLRNSEQGKTMGQFIASGLAGNDILGGVFYTLPAVMTVSGVYSPISLLLAISTLFLWRPVMAELASALPISGGLYAYLLNVSTKLLALIGAVLLILDFASTCVVSAATATSYIVNEVSIPFPAFVCTACILIALTLLSLGGVRESIRVAFAVLIFHLLTMLALTIASLIQWVRVGNDQLKENWDRGQAHSAGGVIRQVFNGFAIGMLGLTGFECAPALITSIKTGRYPYVLRNLHISVFVVHLTAISLVLALIPMEISLQQSNLLSTLASTVSGRWLRIWVVGDAFVVLCAGVLTGVVSASELFEQLARDRVLPQVFLKIMPISHSPFVAILSFAGFCLVVYMSCGGSLTILSEVFSLVWLTVMTLFPVALLLLRFNRGRLPRKPRTSLTIIFTALAVATAVFIGNAAIDVKTLGYFSAYFIGMTLLFLASQNKIHLLRWVYWAYDQNPALHSWPFTMAWGERLIKLMTGLRRQPVCILAKTDEINHLFQMVLYVRQNEETSCLKLVHFHDGESGIPSEMEANAKILDEQFPEITIDLILVQGEFVPANVAALSHRLQIPRSLIFMSCPSIRFPYSVAEFGTRIVVM